MPEFDWDVLEEAATETGMKIYLGKFSTFSTAEKRLMDKEAKERMMCISMGNHSRDETESDDDLYVMKKLKVARK